MYCVESQFKASDYGQAKMNAIIQNLSTSLRPVTSVYFNEVFLKAYYQEMSSTVNPTIFNCYERLLDFWTKDRYNAIINEVQLGQANQAYETRMRETDNPFDFFKNIPLILGLVAFIAVINLVKD